MKGDKRSVRASGSYGRFDSRQRDEAEVPASEMGVGYGQKLRAARSELQQRLDPPRLHPVALGFLIAALIFVVSLISERVLFQISVESYKDIIRGNLQRLARTGATLVDPELHKTFVDPGQESTPAYREAIRPLERFTGADDEIAFVYTCVEKNGRVYFVLDPTAPGDADQDGVDDKSHIMQEYPEAPPELINALRRGEARADIVPYEDRWGKFISGYAPLRDASGSQIGIVGVDLSAEDYGNKLAIMDEAFVQAVGITVLLALLAGLVAGAVQAKSLTIHRQASERDGRYREQIAHTLERVESAIKIAEVSRNRFSDLFEGIPVSCFTFDRHEEVFEWNGHAQRTFDLDAATLLGRDLLTVLGHEIYGTAQAGFIKRVLQGKSFSDQVWSDGKRHFLFNGHPLNGPDGEISGGILAAVDISKQKAAEAQVQLQLEDLNAAHGEANLANQKLKEANAQLEELARTDQLTGLPNRRAFYDVLQIALAQAERGHGFALVQADIDYFKLYNDVYGHHAGDHVLKLFADTLKQSVRPADFVARHGGEEFYLILEGAGRTEAIRIVERIRKAVSAIGTGYGQITASFGIALWYPGVESDEKLMQLSDNALYEAKRQGRNRVIVASPDELKAA